ncbi:PKD domain-containing protein [Nocardioides sp.]|uniref:PKD domain-containing protein n=1 Tax=Nocardioides sp. TaxID=35761 RepID=UPI003D0FD741
MFQRFASLLVSAALVSVGLLLVGTPSSMAVDSPPGTLVSERPAPGTPHVLNGRVNSVVQVGGQIVLGGTFTTARNDGSQAQLTRSRLLAFDATTGQISNSFDPAPNGGVNVVLPAGDGTSVYVGGSFTSIGGVTRSRVARVRVSDGAVLTSFNAGSISGAIRDLRLSEGRLWLAGSFAQIQNHAQRALATVDPATGVFDGFMDETISGVHNGGGTRVSKIDVTPDGDRLAVIGNFDAVNGANRAQFFMLDLSGASSQLADYATPFFTPPCAAGAFDSYMRDLDFSPDGSFLVISTTGAYGGSEGPCDTTSRWETDSSGTNLAPSWVDYTGGDTTYGVEITSSAVYVGGHQRWQNNAFAGDRAGPGSVSRPGIAALDPINGLPFSWNPTRDRGVGVFDFLYTSQGLWVASDTTRIGGQSKSRIALMPAAGGSQIPGIATPSLPNDVYLAGVSGQVTDPSVLYRVNAGGPALVADSGIDWQGDTDASPSPHHNAGSSRATYATVPTLDASVSAGTPRDIFSSELWDPAGDPEQQWDFAVPTGTPVEVRLYLANRCTCTQGVGQRVFNVDIDGVRRLADLDMVAEEGHDVGFERSFDIVSDGNVDIDLGHVTENPLVNGIEIRRTDLGSPPPTDPTIVRRSFDGSSAGATSDVQGGGLDWNALRGAFMLNGQLYTAWSDGTFTRRAFDGTTYGAPVAVDTSDENVPLADWASDIQQATGMFYDSGRIYFTRGGSDQLYYRYFTAESDVVGAKRLVASGSVAGIDFGQVRGLFTSGGKLYWGTAEGNLHRIDWSDSPSAGAPVPGTAATISGPGIDGNAWAARAMFIYQGDGAGTPPNTPPVASFTVSCAGLTCQFDASGSSDNGGSVAGYAWDFGDGTNGTGAQTSHAYDSSGQRTVRLTVTDNQGATNSTTRVADPAQATSDVSFVGSSETSGNRRAHSVTVPAATQPGDTLVLFMTLNSSNGTVTGPTGWTAVQSVDSTGFRGRLWTRTATAADPGTRVTTSTSALLKSTMTVAAYRGTAPTVATSQASVVLSSQTDHTSPAVQVTDPGSWVLTYYGQKSGNNVTWTPPGEQTLRADSSVGGGGGVSSILVDSSGPVATGPQGALTATTSEPTSRTIAFSVVVTGE